MLHQIDLLDANKLNAVIKEKYKIDFSTWSHDSYRRNVYEAMVLSGEKNIEEYILKVADSQDCFAKFCANIRVDVTEFFRDPSFWKQFREQVSPKLLSHQTIRIWVPNYSSGQELMSLLICLREWGAIDRCKIIATEINEEYLGRFNQALFPLKEMELAQSNYERYGGKSILSNYYTIDNDMVKFDQSLLRNVQFKVNVLGYDEMPGKFDLILCRNNMIYFNHKLQEKLLKLFAESTLLGGFLAIGVKESIEHFTSAKEFKAYCLDEKIYQRV